MAYNNIFLLHRSFFPDSYSRGGENLLDDLFATLQTYQMEFDAHSPIGRLPRCFSREFGDSIDSYVMLRDPCYNEIEVHVTKRSRELYFDEGWMALRNIYDLSFGAWVTFAYVNPKLLTIRLTTRWGTEVDYPVFNPPLQCLLPKVDASPFIPPKSFVRSITKEITFYDLHSGTLILPWYGFGEFVYKFQHSDLILIDNYGDRYPCKLKFGVDPEGHLACKVSVGWVDYCTVHGVCQGDKIEASVMEPLHEYELYLSLYYTAGSKSQYFLILANMSYNRVETSLALQYLRAPLNLQTNDHHERRLNEIRLKYRTYYVEYNVYDGAVMLPRLLIDDFVDQICRFSYLVDANENQFEVLVERIGRNFYFTRGWTAVRDFYDIRAGAWLLLMYIGTTHFGLMVEDRLHELIAPPIFNPPIRFNLHKSNITPYFVNNVPQSTMLAYSHAQTFFNVSHEKTLTYYDITSGFLMLPYDGFGEQVFGQQTTSIKLVDDCCNEWDCFLIHVTFPFKYFNVGGEWSSLVAGRRLKVGDSVKFGVEGYGHNDVVYLTLSP